MFTDEEMDKIYALRGIDGLSDVIQVLLNTLSAKAVSGNDIKRANNIWLLFCSKHAELNSAVGKRMFVNVLIKLNPQYEDAIEALCNVPKK